MKMYDSKYDFALNTVIYMNMRKNGNMNMKMSMNMKNNRNMNMKISMKT